MLNMWRQIGHQTLGLSKATAENVNPCPGRGQGIGHAPGRSPSPQDQTVLSFNGNIMGLDIGQKPGPIGVVAGQNGAAAITAINGNGIDRPDGLNGRINLIKQGDNPFLMGAGDIDTLEAQSGQSLHRFGQEIGRDRQRDIDQIKPQVSRRCIVHRRTKAVVNGPAEEAEEFCVSSYHL
jgi:hypothetical protein